MAKPGPDHMFALQGIIKAAADPRDSPRQSAAVRDLPEQAAQQAAQQVQRQTSKHNKPHRHAVRHITDVGYVAALRAVLCGAV